MWSGGGKTLRNTNLELHPLLMALSAVITFKYSECTFLHEHFYLHFISSLSAIIFFLTLLSYPNRIVYFLCSVMKMGQIVIISGTPQGWMLCGNGIASFTSTSWQGFLTPKPLMSQTSPASSMPAVSMMNRATKRESPNKLYFCRWTQAITILHSSLIVTFICFMYLPYIPPSVIWSNAKIFHIVQAVSGGRVSTGLGC